ncbi:hypothetical protein [Terriglobus roseus]|uniref:AsmA-like C-terminal region n=1 Tax=Terriglobus roseus TaxID=392734 RepID=A0A1H4J8M1_9BACT|nr:hypothetical protein [Terriglobus roseus]SEB42664.1 AsmA-like C-terminal region [Terriglobus roseus]
MQNKDTQETSSESPVTVALRSRRVWAWIGAAVLIGLLALLVAGEVMVRRAGPIVKGRVIETLSTRFNSHVELDSFDVSLLQGLSVSGGGLRIYAPADVVAAGATEPLIAIQRFEFRTSLRSLFVKPMHVGTVHVAGMTIYIPPRQQRAVGASSPRKRRKLEVLADEIVVENSTLVIGTLKQDKEPKRFQLQRIRLRNVGRTEPALYDATLVNAFPRGDIHATGKFGPWNEEVPGESPVTGDYTFDHADLNTIKGIGGTLSSVGKFSGRLDRIEADGTTVTPDFSLDTAKHPMPLTTHFHAVIDGTNGDTYLQSVQAKLGSSQFTCAGAVVNVKGEGHITDLDVNIPAGHLRDFLELAVKTQPPFMQSVVNMKVHLRVPYGKESVTRKLQIQGGFTLQQIHFTNPQVQDKVDMLSLRAQGTPKEAKPGATDVRSQMSGSLALSGGQLTVSRLNYLLPGAQLALDGVYTLDGKTFGFHGKVRTEATLSHMIATPWKSFLLRLADPFFSKHGAGAEIPVKITGTEGAPKFGLDFGNRDKKKTEAEESKDDLQSRKDELTPDGRIARRPPPGLPITRRPRQ